jgi:competence protein ComEA
VPRRRVRPEQVAEAQARLAAVVPPRAVGGWVPPPDPQALDPPEVVPRAEPAGQEVVPLAELLEPDEDPPPEAEPPQPPQPLRPFLPPTLRGGRWDPGRRGAIALGVVALVAALVALIVLLRSRPTEVTAPTGGAGGVSLSSPASAAVVVDVAGKVRRPGLVRLPAGARVDDALRAAGGVRPGASLGLINLARRLVDGEQVLVGVEQLAAAGGSAAAAAPGVDLNAADLAALDGLPGIGPVLAQHVLDWREEHGRFTSVDQLREVPGIGESKFASLKNKVRV